jgi:DNA-binding transcriptional MerR regulator
MPGPNSSNDLILEQIREVLSERQQDLRDGISPRSVTKRIDEHERQDERKHEGLEERIRKLEEHAARSEAHVETTARFILPPTPAVGFPPTTINVGNGPRSSRPSLAKGLKQAAENPFVKWIAVALAIAASHLMARCGIPQIPH